jgi:hypothetical protein
MQVKIPCRRYCVQDYGGQQSINIPRNISKNVMSVRGSTNPIEGMRCL